MSNNLNTIDDSDWDFTPSPSNKISYDFKSRILHVDSLEAYADLVFLEASFANDNFGAYLSYTYFQGQDFFIYVNFDGLSFKKHYSSTGTLLQFVNLQLRQVYENTNELQLTN